MKNETFNAVAIVIVVILVIDFACFIAWGLSGQTPVDGFYAGAITSNVLKVLKF
jgi:hypothetical protein